MDELEDTIECPACMGLEGECPRCDGRGFVKLASLDDDERFSLNLLNDTMPPLLLEDDL